MERVIELAKELGKELKNHPATQEYIAASKAIQNDEQAQELLRQYDIMAQQLAQKEAYQQPIDEQERKQLAELQAKLSSNEKIKNLMDAQARYSDLTQQVNQAIMENMGEDSD